MVEPQSESAEGSPRMLRTVFAAALLAFFIGLAVMAWALTRWEPAQRLVVGERGATPPSAAMPAAQPPIAPSAAPLPPPPPPVAATNAIDARIAELEGRMARIDLRAAAAASNAARAEGLLIAFAARRAVDRGVPLGYLEGELRNRFGAAQPRAVATVIAASQAPITLEMLHGELQQLKPRLAVDARQDGWWESTRRAIAGLIVVRRESGGSPAPDARLARAEVRLASGQVDGALTEVARLPGATAGEAWMGRARRFIDAQRALDVLEAAALTEGEAAVVRPAAPVPDTAL